MPADQDVDTKIYVDASEARRFVEDVLQGNGVHAENTEIVARCLVAADLRGLRHPWVGFWP